MDQLVIQALETFIISFSRMWTLLKGFSMSGGIHWKLSCSFAFTSRLSEYIEIPCRLLKSFEVLTQKGGLPNCLSVIELFLLNKLGYNEMG